MARIVMKFGGTSVADLDRIRRAAGRVKAEVEAGTHVAVVVSAMAGVTNAMVKLVADAASLADLREYDVVVSSGEQVTSGLMAMVLQSIGVPARPWMGWRIPIRTDDAHGSARIEGIEVQEMIDRKSTRLNSSH